MTSFIARFSKLARLISGFVCLGLTIQLVADGQPERDGQWLQYRRDPALTGRSPLKGNITAAAIKWKYELSAREGFFTLRLDGSAAGMLAPEVFPPNTATREFAVTRFAPVLLKRPTD